MVYLDHAATTPVRPEAVAAMLPYLTEHFGNPSGSHAIARRAKRALEDSREVVAAALGCQPREVVFTAGGTEADNLAITGTIHARGGIAACSAIEHHAVLHAVAAGGGVVVPVDGDGVVDVARLAEAARAPEVTLVSVMAANNEVGVIQPLDEVAAAVRDASAAVLHTDAVQAFPWYDVGAAAAGFDLVAVSAHKFGGPKGVGALVVRDGANLAPILHGGGQERDLRSGTHNVAGIVGMAAAAAATVRERDEAAARVRALRDRLADAVAATVPGVVETGRREARLPGHLHLRIPGVESEALLVLLDDAGVCASAGSACASGALEPSHVLAAMGVPAGEASGALRLSLGTTTTDDDVDLAVKVLADAVDRLRS